jgi:hypothetical protein
MKKYEIINNFELVSRKNIVNMELGSDKNYEPALLIDTGNVEFQFPLVNGYMISRCNEFLRSFGTDAVVEFKTYQQYSNLIKYIMRIIFLTSLEPRILTGYILHSIDMIEMKVNEGLK